MTIMNTELYEALIEAGASDEKAKAASNVVAEQNKRFDKLDYDIADFRKDVDHKFKGIDHKFEGVDHKFDIIARDLKITIGGYFIVAVGVILAAMKFMT